MSESEIEIVEVKDNDDGSANVTFALSTGALKFYAAIGLYEVLLRAAEEKTNGHPDSPRSANAGTGAVGAGYVQGKV